MRVAIAFSNKYAVRPQRAKQQEQIATLSEITKTHKQCFTRFYGYHQAATGDQHLEEESIGLQLRVETLEEKSQIAD